MSNPVVLSISLLQTPEDTNGTSNHINGLLVLLILKKMCKMIIKKFNDYVGTLTIYYIKESLGLFLDIFNIFIRILGLGR